METTDEVVNNEYVKGTLHRNSAELSSDAVDVEAKSVKELRKILHTYGMSGNKMFQIKIQNSVYGLELEYESDIHPDYILDSIDRVTKIIQDDLGRPDVTESVNSLKSSIFSCLAKIKPKLEVRSEVPEAPMYKSTKEPPAEVEVAASLEELTVSDKQEKVESDASKHDKIEEFRKFTQAELDQLKKELGN